MKMSLLLQILFYLLAGYLFLLLFMFLSQDAFLYFPPAAKHRNHGHANVQDYQLDRGDDTLRGWLVNPQFVREKLLIYYGGNAEDIFQNIDEYGEIQGASLFVAYRGFGPSSGRPSEKALFEDGLAVFDDVASRYAPKVIILIGRSLGSGIACHVAAGRDVSGVALITPYDSILNVAKSHYPWLPVSLLLKHRFDSLGVLKKIHCPVLVVYGGRDQVIRPERTRNLINHIVGDREVVFIAQADHGTIDMFPEYWRALLQFIDERSSTVE